MRESDTKVDLFDEDLLVINDIRFTPRELDILSCLLKARSTKKIASLLSIYPKTVRNHLHNIMTKLGCNSRDSIIDFVERSEKLSLLKEHYSALFLKASFEQSLKEISKIKREEKVSCKLIYWTETTLNDSLVRNIQAHLNLVGVNTSLELRKNKPIFSELLNELQKDYYRIYILPKTVVETLQASGLSNEKTVSKFPQNNQSNRRLFLLLEKNPEVESFANEGSCSFLNLGIQENYFISFFELLMKLLPNLNVDKIVTEFKDQYNNKKEHSEQNFSQVVLKEKKSENFSFFQRWGYILSIGFFIALLGTGCLFYLLAQKNQEAAFLRSDLIIPVEVAFLNRPELITQIDKAFNGNEGIQTVALVGIGGSGKTTLARQYARQQKAPLIWEINAETKSNLLESFENLAYTLAKTEEDKSILRDLTEIKNSAERQKRLVEFVKGHLKSQSNWFLIYDNVEKFTDVQKYFPLDPNTWGTGRIILTTRDSNIQNNKYVNHSLQIGELNENQKLALFTKIMGQNNKKVFDVTQKAEIKTFLKNIPPFPLDVSVAAYYVKTSNIPYEKYLENINKNNTDLSDIQNDILRESGDYTKTRYSIVTLSIQKLMESHKDFADLLLFICLLDSQNIPKDLLVQYKDPGLADSFIYHLKKYSLITNNPFAGHSNASISIHRSTQFISLLYLKKLLNLKTNNTKIKHISDALIKYIDCCINKEDYLKMKLLVSHYEAFLKNSDLLTNCIKGEIGSEVGKIYYFLNHYKKAKQFLEESLENLNNCEKENPIKIAQNFVYQGNISSVLGDYENAKYHIERALLIYKNCLPNDSREMAWATTQLGTVYGWLGNYEKAKELLEQSLLIYKKYIPESYPGMAVVLTELGNSYRDLGQHKNAKNSLEQALAIYQKLFPKNNIRIAQLLIYIGIVEQELGHYKKFKNLIEQSLLIFKGYFSENHIDFVYACAHLGNAYLDLEDYEKAKNVLENNLTTCKKNFSEDHPMVSWISTLLGKAYMGLGHYEKANTLLKKSLLMYENYYEQDHIEMGRTLIIMGQNALLAGNLELSEELFQKTLEIFKKQQHPEGYMALERLAELYLKKSMYSADKGLHQYSKAFIIRAIFYLKEALKIVKTHFPEDSPHKARIELKLKELEKVKIGLHKTTT